MLEDPYNVIRRFFRSKNKYPSDQTQILLSMAYDEAMGIYNHSTEQYNPLATVKVHEAEDTSKLNPLRRALFRYEYQQIKDRFGISFKEYLQYSRGDLEQFTAVATELNQMRKKTTSEVEGEVEKEFKKHGH